MMRPDGHPGVYMRRDPFTRGMPERLQSDCLHFCMPGPVDTFNVILERHLTERHTVQSVPALVLESMSVGVEVTKSMTKAESGA
ncbi:hypothetical protein PR202_ga17624 [Eleusine coracana subsp. coracana]|uniref:Trichome birefringence-like C-terminal domain-containing protein n=1 Tax=Eleusine coracana subsp. coracana TaxID=191504 RepID=A0AAV5CRA4_ELECO|nr:hypothetical protein PR202_ga17377 [Eleusine coracana subsp. coracana]GJN00442.1 hypothetical protein PR202_ga17624 [Eleusine coracana subsp. coracana]